MIELSLIVPIFNEEEILESSVSKLRWYLSQIEKPYEILLVSNGSTDRTVEIARTLSGRWSECRDFALAERGVGAAFVLGAKEARGRFIVSLDADLSSDLSFIARAAELLEDAEMVVGSKTIGSQRRSLVRVAGSQLYILLTQLLLNLTISDYSIGCKAYRREAIVPVLDELSGSTGYVLELALLLARHKKRIVQIGVDCDDHRPSRFSLWREGFYRYGHLLQCWRRNRREVDVTAHRLDIDNQ